MKLFHLSDLHLGKRVNEFSMLEEQKNVLDQIISASKLHRPDGVMIAGDVYDKSIPSTEAIDLFDDFICALSELSIPVFIISGNHDSPERLAFGRRLMDKSGVYISPVYSRDCLPITLLDNYGAVNIYMLPFIKPVHARAAFPDEKIESYTDALSCAVKAMNIDAGKRNILLAHQFVTGASRSDSEEITVGGLDNVDATVFESFDYVALGHIHRPQNIIENKIRYCGTPLKYSFSEIGNDNSITVVELQQKGDVSISTIPLNPIHDMRKLRGTFDELILGSSEDYLGIVLTDEDYILNALDKLRNNYPNIMQLDYDNTQTKNRATLAELQQIKETDPFALFSEFYQKQNNMPLSDEQSAFIKELIRSVWEEKE